MKQIIVLIRIFIIVCLLNASLIGCGQKGPLFLPEKETEKQNEKE